MTFYMVNMLYMLYPFIAMKPRTGPVLYNIQFWLGRMKGRSAIVFPPHVEQWTYNSWVQLKEYTQLDISSSEMFGRRMDINQNCPVFL